MLYTFPCYSFLTPSFLWLFSTGTYSLLLPLGNVTCAHAKPEVNDPRKEHTSNNEVKQTASGAWKELPSQGVLSTIRGYTREQTLQGKNKLVVAPASQTSEIHNNAFLKFQEGWISDVSKKRRVSLCGS